MSDIIFITPTLEESISEESVGTLLLASILHNNGLDVSILPFFRFGDPNDFDTFLKNATDAICREKPHIVSFYTRCDSYHIMLKLAMAVKSNCNAFIVFGGPQADITAADTLREIPYVDFICCGEGETTVEPFFRSLLKNTPDFSIAGLVYRLNGEIVCNPRPALIQDLDTLPSIDYSLSPISPMYFHQEYFPIDVGRGCPFSCTYCSTKTFWGRKYRLKSPQRILDEIKELHNKFGVTSFAFLHDMFTLNRKQVTQTCQLLKTLDFPVTWKCSARLDCIDNTIIDTMIDAGMSRIFIGIETGSPHMQEIINKRLNLDDVLEKISYISSKNIQVLTSFIYGFPEENEEDISLTISLISELAKIKNVSYAAHLCTFLPGTELSVKYKTELSPAHAFSNITGDIAIEACSDLIKRHPKLFPQFLEYQTQLRTNLEFFELFIRTWQNIQPVYQYISEKYSKKHLIQMYYDFVHANYEILQNTRELSPANQIWQIIANGGFPKVFIDDPCYDIIVDYHRMVALQTSQALRDSGTATGAFCFSPLHITHQTPIQKIPRALSVVSYTYTAEGKVKTKIYSRKQ